METILKGSIYGRLQGSTPFACSSHQVEITRVSPKQDVVNQGDVCGEEVYFGGGLGFRV